MQVVFCVANHISNDQRVLRMAQTLIRNHAEVHIIGRDYPRNAAPVALPVHTERLRLMFNKGPLFYSEFNIRLFFRLMFVKARYLVANDLDTLPAAFLASKFRSIRLVYDSHEFFTEVPELINRRVTRSIWLFIERIILPHIQHASTVSYSIANAYYLKYHIRMEVIRNLPLRISEKPTGLSYRNTNEKIILYQGALNAGRGLDLAIRAMEYVNGARLVILGEGDLSQPLRALTRHLGLEDRVTFYGRINPTLLPAYTCQADLGISLEEAVGLSYYYALPNKLFDYIQCGVPVLVSDLPEMGALVKQYDVGLVVGERTPRAIAAMMTEMLADEDRRKKWKINLASAAEILCWENEEPAVIRLHFGNK